VEESAQEGPRLHHVSVRGREHPHPDFAFSVLGPSVQAMEFALPPARAGAQDLDAGYGRGSAAATPVERGANSIDQPLSRRAHSGESGVLECADHFVRSSSESWGWSQRQRAPRVGAVVLALLLGAQSPVEGETTRSLGVHDGLAAKSLSYSTLTRQRP